MSKRALEESASGSPEPVAGGNISISELLANSEDPEFQGPGSKKPRNFIASVVLSLLSKCSRIDLLTRLGLRKLSSEKDKM
jgi:hypothetical protein